MLNDLLNVAPGSISDVAPDDLGSLWTVFTKVKGNIKDGRRLENLSWRLWYQEVLNAQRKLPIPDSSAAHLLSSPPTQQPELSSDSETATDSDGLQTDVESPTVSSPPTSSLTTSHADSASSKPEDRSAAASRQSSASPASSSRKRRKVRLSSSHNDSAGHQPKRPVNERSNSTPTRACTTRSRRPPSFNLGKLMAAPILPELGALHVQITNPLSSPEEELPPAVHVSATPTLVVLGPTPRPTPPESPRAPADKDQQSDRQYDSLLPVPSIAGNPAPTNPIPHEAPPQTTTAGPGPPASTAPVPVDDGRSKRRTFFFKESPSAGEEAAGSSGSSVSTAAKTPVQTASPQDIGPTPEAVVTQRDVQAQQPTVAPVKKLPVTVAVRKGKEPARQLTRQFATGGHRTAKFTAHNRHHSTVFGQASKNAPVRSKSSAAITTVAHNVAGPSGQQTTNNITAAPPQPSALRQSTSASRLTSAVSSAKTIVAPSSPPRIPEPAPAPAPPASTPAVPRVAPPAPKAQPPAPAKSTKTARVEAASSEFETDSDGDDSSWASDYSDEDDEPETGNLAKEAAAEAARQRDMFQKVPTRSYVDLAKQARNPGLLSTLFNPPAALIPHIQGTRSAVNLGPRPAPPPMTNMAAAKSAAAVPQAAQVTVTQTAQVAPAAPTKAAPRPGYRLGGRPDDQEMEDSSDDDNEDDGVQMSTSVAQRRLEELAGRRSKQVAPTPQQQRTSRMRSQLGMTSTINNIMRTEEPVTRTASAPIVLPHPYNLPAPAPPATPRTTRREMLATEMTESLRRQILWERQTNQRTWRRASNTSNTGPKPKPIGAYAQDDYHATGW